MIQKIALHGVPRSGTSWVGEIFNSSPHTIYQFQPLFSYALKDFLTPASTATEIGDFFDRLCTAEDDFISQRIKRKQGEFPIFEKMAPTHVVYKEVRYINILCNMMRKTDDVFFIFIIRNPLSVINSWLKAPREFRRDLGWKEREEWRYALKKNMNRPEEYNGYEKWKEAAYLFHSLHNRYPQRVRIICYSDLIADPYEVTQQAFNAVSLPFTIETEKFLFESTATDNSDPYSVYRSNASDDKWKNELDGKIRDEILTDLDGTVLEKYV
ncbi:sulfotransferase [uncultured Desulfosarcina sp.]|uniref:sulfotransferase n=1 Tax=uncultured Desulfosarcina sp. TaxID=218289 RepID=UPI0029C7246B|nr:sulfotransferase [uncultured Desulfosarcina sp.]